MARWDPQDVAEGLQHYRVAGVEDAPAPNLEREIDGVEALLPEVTCQPLDRHACYYLSIGKQFERYINSV